MPRFVLEPETVDAPKVVTMRQCETYEDDVNIYVDGVIVGYLDSNTGELRKIGGEIESDPADDAPATIEVRGHKYGVSYDGCDRVSLNIDGDPVLQILTGSRGVAHRVCDVPCDFTSDRGKLRIEFCADAGWIRQLQCPQSEATAA